LDRVSRAGLARPAFAMGVVGFIVSVVAVVLISAIRTSLRSSRKRLGA